MASMSSTTNSVSEPDDPRSSFSSAAHHVFVLFPRNASKVMAPINRGVRSVQPFIAPCLPFADFITCSGNNSVGLL